MFDGSNSITPMVFDTAPPVEPPLEDTIVERLKSHSQVPDDDLSFSFASWVGKLNCEETFFISHSYIN